MHDYPRFLPVGEAALTVEFGNGIDPAFNMAAIALGAALEAAGLSGICETVPSYRSLLVHYDPTVIGFDRTVAALRPLIAVDGQGGAPDGRLWTVPVAYGAPFGADMDEVSGLLGMTPAGIAAAHAGAEYRVYTVGFAPGMPMMGGLPAALHIPRRQSPRPGVPVGAVIIGGMQTAIVPVQTLSGWYILGRTPLRLFDPCRADPFLVRHGDTVRFRQVGAADCERMAALPHAELLALIGEPG